MDTASHTDIIVQYESDPESVYNTWFVDGEERTKAFRAIRRGVREGEDHSVVQKIARHAHQE